MISEDVSQYLHTIIPNRDPLVTEMEQFAKEHQVPIMELVGIEALLQILSLKEVEKVLEIGTAIGYSAIRMAKRLPNSTIVSVERDSDRYQLAQDYVKRACLDDRVHLIFGDAIDVHKQVEQHASFDCLFIDAAKGQYDRFFDLYSPLVKKNGLIISDNILFRGYVADADPAPKRLRPMVNKIRAYNEKLMKNDEYETTIFPIGDGIAVSKKLGGEQ